MAFICRSGGTADTLSSGGSASNRVRVQISSSAPYCKQPLMWSGFYYPKEYEAKIWDRGDKRMAIIIEYLKGKVERIRG